MGSEGGWMWGWVRIAVRRVYSEKMSRRFQTLWSVLKRLFFTATVDATTIPSCVVLCFTFLHKKLTALQKTANFSLILRPWHASLKKLL